MHYSGDFASQRKAKCARKLWLHSCLPGPLALALGAKAVNSTHVYPCIPTSDTEISPLLADRQCPTIASGPRGTMIVSEMSDPPRAFSDRTNPYWDWRRLGT